jgi:hypothetical protein
MPFVLVCFQAAVAPRPENSDSDEKDALFALDTQSYLRIKAQKMHPSFSSESGFSSRGAAET